MTWNNLILKHLHIFVFLVLKKRLQTREKLRRRRGKWFIVVFQIWQPKGNACKVFWMKMLFGFCKAFSCPWHSMLTSSSAFFFFLNQASLFVKHNSYPGKFKVLYDIQNYKKKSNANFQNISKIMKILKIKSLDFQKSLRENTEKLPRHV